MRKALMKIRMQGLSLMTALAALLAAAQSAWPQAYPARPVTIVVPFAAGGPTDVIARVIAEKMQGALGQPVVIENISGAGGTIAAVRVARAEPDGYTLEIGNNGSNVLAGAMYSLPVDLVTDFAPIAEVTVNPQIIVTKKSIPANNLKELIGWLKGNAKDISVGNGGAVAEVSVINFETMTGTHFQHIPYRGAAPAIQDLIAGHIDMMIDQVSNSIPQIKAGTIKAYAVAAKTRASAAPDIPTTDEAGLPGLYGSLWHALWAPKGTPDNVIAKLTAAVHQALADPAVKARLAALGHDVVSPEEQAPTALGAFQAAEREKWWPIVKAAGLKGE